MIYLYLDRNTIKFLYLKKTILNQQETLYQQKTYGSDLIDKGKKTVRVVDYKTGPAKSQNDILGKTKNSSGDLYRQLVFYKLLFVQDQRLAYQVVEAELDFVESGLQKGKFIKRSFDIPDQAVTELKATIKKSMQAIRNYQFNRTTDYQRHCVRCEYRDHCWPEGIPTSGQ